jgi:hypothetical protein
MPPPVPCMEPWWGGFQIQLSTATPVNNATAAKQLDSIN